MSRDDYFRKNFEILIEINLKTFCVDLDGRRRKCQSNKDLAWNAPYGSAYINVVRYFSPRSILFHLLDFSFFLFPGFSHPIFFHLLSPQSL